MRWFLCIVLVLLSWSVGVSQSGGSIVVNGHVVPGMAYIRQGNVYLFPVELIPVLADAMAVQAGVQPDAGHITWGRKQYSVTFVRVSDHSYVAWRDLAAVIPTVRFGATTDRVVFDTRRLPSSNAARGGTASASALASRILAFAQARVGQLVGDGECTTLVDEALRSVGARSLGDFGRYGPDSDYVWGTPVQLEDVQPGDIVQFRDYQMTLVAQHPDGSRHHKSSESPHHTAIVVSNDGNGQLTLIHQNASSSKEVKVETLCFSSGTFDVNGDIVTTEVSGRIWCYRPQKR